jgi:hypothetical protein
MRVCNRQSVKSVAQIFNLLYRRVALGRALNFQTVELFNDLQIANLRYGRVQLCATKNLCGGRL